MIDTLKIKEYYLKLEGISENKITFHIANGIIGDFFYIEFSNSHISFEEIISWLIYQKIKFYNHNEFNIKNILERYIKFPIISEHIATKEDLETLEYIINHDILYFMDSYKEDDYANIVANTPNQEISGYYKNDIYVSDTVPKMLLDKIFSADKYTTLINENWELMIVMEHNGKQSLFYSMNDQKT